METLKVHRGDIENLKKAIGKKYNYLKNPEPTAEIWITKYTKEGRISKEILNEPYSFEFLTVVIE